MIFKRRPGVKHWDCLFPQIILTKKLREICHLQSQINYVITWPAISFPNNFLSPLFLSAKVMGCRVDIPSLCEKCPNTEFFLVRISRIRTENLKDTECLSVFSPNKRKYGPEKILYFDTFHALTVLDICYQNLYIWFASLVCRATGRGSKETRKY